MKIFAIFFLSALVGCYGYKACYDAKAQVCWEKLSGSLYGRSTESAACSDLREAIRCYEDAAYDCPGAYWDRDIHDSIDDLKDINRNNCVYNLFFGPEEEVTEEEVTEEVVTEEEVTEEVVIEQDDKNCLEENEDYLFECMYEGTAAAMEALADADDDENIDENVLQCGLYGLITGCFVERIDEKCGAEVARMAEEEFSDLPEDIKEACEAASGANVPEFRLLGDRRKKK